MKKNTLPVGSSPSIRSQLNYFENQTFDISIANTFVENIPPYFNLENNTAPVEFIVNSSNSLYLI